MTPPTTRTILTEYAGMLHHNLEPTHLAMYLEELELYTPAEVRQAMKQHVRESKWFPRPAEIIGHIRQARTAASRESEAEQVLGAARGKRSKKQFRRPDGNSIMQHIIDLKAEGLTPDEIADRLCGPEDPATEPRYRCHVCRDTKFVRVFRRETLDGAYQSRDHRVLTGCVPCRCDAATPIAESQKWKGQRYDPYSMVLATGDEDRDRQELERYIEQRTRSKRVSEFDEYATPHEELF